MRITLGLVLSWIFGVLAAIVGISSLFSNPLPGIFALLISAVLLPPVNKFIADKFNFSISGGLKAGIVIVLLVLIGVSMPSSHSESTENASEDTAPVQNAQAATSTIEKEVQSSRQQASIPTATQANNQAASAVANETVSQKNAVRKAKSYLDYSAFSHDGLVDQLEYEQFSHADAVYGADNSGANWNEQAAEKAKSYMEYSAFSRGGLIAQLKYDKFTQAQAEYGANAVGL